MMVDDAAAPEPRTSQGQNRRSRGLLMLLVVVGHNQLFRAGFYPAYHMLYNFHVAAFLILPFVRPQGGRPAGVMDELRRYYVPFAAFTTLYALLWYAAAAPGHPVSVAEAVPGWLRALVLANATALKQATGLEMLWFLPAFILVSLARRAVVAAPILAPMLALALHLTVGMLPPGAIAWLPWGLPIVAYMLFPCLAGGLVAQARVPAATSLALSLGVFVACTAACRAGHFYIALADFKVMSARDLPGLVVTDLQMIAFTVLVCRHLSRLALPLVERIGRHSLQVYLIHGPVGYATVAAFRHGFGAAAALSPPMMAWMVALSVAVTLALSIAAAQLLMATATGRWLFAWSRPDRDCAQKSLAPPRPAPGGA